MDSRLQIAIGIGNSIFFSNEKEKSRVAIKFVDEYFFETVENYFAKGFENGIAQIDILDFINAHKDKIVEEVSVHHVFNYLATIEGITIEKVGNNVFCKISNH